MYGMRQTSDAFGRALLDWVQGGTVPEIVERDDGLTEIGAGPDGYLMAYKEWPYAEHRSIHYVRGRVIDVGCGSGRVALHLQERGYDVVAIDASPLAVKAARLNGVRKTSCKSVDQLNDSIHEFDTIVLFGNNLGVFGTPERARRILAGWARKLPPGARILVESTNPYSGGAPVIDRAYCVRNRRKGVALGQCRMRIWYDRSPSKWFSWFFVSQSELKRLIRGTGWRQVQILASASDEPYVAVLERM
jgi:SAM-dependent methyltransferase